MFHNHFKHVPLKTKILDNMLLDHTRTNPSFEEMLVVRAFYVVFEYQMCISQGSVYDDARYVIEQTELYLLMCTSYCRNEWNS